MSKATMAVEGFLSKDAQVGRTQSGDAFLNLSVGHTPRRKNRDSGEWEDAGDTLWVGFTLWRDEAEAFEQYATKGTLVRIEGEPSLRTWESNGKSGTSLELKFARAAVVPRAARGVQARGQVADEPWSAPAASGGSTEAWAAPAGAYGDETPF